VSETLPGIGNRPLVADSSPLPEGVATRLSELCRRMGVEVEIGPGLASDAPPIRGGRDERYAIGRELGSGGGGRVYLATDRDLRRSVALKVMQEAHASDPQRVQAFLEEAIITAGLEHPGIVPVYDIGWSPTLGIYYTMKRLGGRTLADVLQAAAQSPEAARAFGLYRSLGAFVELARAVAHAHRRGVIHSDLKPDNVFVGEYGEIVVVDWGMAQILGPAGESQVRARIRGGTPEYMAPEQCALTGSALDVGVDVWALGAILYELLTGTVPFRGKDPQETAMRVMIEPLVAPRERAPERSIPPGIEQICLRALERDRARRYPSAAELLGDVEAYLAGTRERARRAEQIVHALETAQLLLDTVAPPEADLDAALDRGDADQEHLDALRAQLLASYAPAGQALLRGLELDREAAPLQRAAGDLYWRIFTRVYPSKIKPTAAIAERALDLLTRLSQRACAAIVRAGQQRAGDPAADPEGRPASAESMWLTVVRMVAESDPAGATSAMRDVVARVTSLKEIPLFKAMHAASLLPVAEACRELTHRAGATVFRQGDPGDALFVLLAGHVDILRDGSVINTLGPGECFGEIAVLGETTRTASAVAVDEVRTLSLDAGRFRQIVRESGEIGLAVIQALNQRLRVATRREAALRSLAGAILAQQADAAEPGP